MSEVHKFTFDGYPAVKLNGVPYVRADSLEAMGYVKVVRCRECKLQHSPYCYHEGFDDKDYCPEGEPKEAKPD